ncbi:Rieske (2Fe-2S) protein [Micromonospora olivasterospora]|uniref:Nitrite reductase/ring-hydroxylating ferredoxin subunit n=1 Tax=Micromonospora olivasterospora TaxID=1880 RepID=A0A562I3D0_MICOL|nr:Rieske (2Fe-2S) protein [Micromonospora olivasterospora]TWH65559.1 nitrite reductase/ring-hydroxylating ferredoxin subunit [Micromonospora olivasterospora]
MSDEQAQTGPGTRTRRALLAGAGAVGAAVVLSACGGDDTDGGQATTATTATPGGGDSTGALARTSDIPVGGGVIYASKGVVVTQPVAGEFKGFVPICTHQQCPVSNVDGGTINCTCHFSKFSIADGSVKGGPATRPLEPKSIKVEGDQISLA